MLDLSGWHIWEMEGDRGGWINFLPGSRLELDAVTQNGSLPDKWELTGDTVKLTKGTEVICTLKKDAASIYWTGSLKRWMAPEAKLMEEIKPRPFIGGTYTLKRYDLLTEAIRSLLMGSLVPPLLYVVDNGGGLKTEFFRQFDELAARKGTVTNLIHPFKNMGISPSVNMLAKLAVDADLLLFNDDIVFGHDTVRNMRRCKERMACACNGSCLVQDRELWQTLGDYDERFWPGYYDDTDYRLRMRLAGLPVGYIRDKALKHAGFATGCLTKDYEANAQLFHRKWRIEQ